MRLASFLDHILCLIILASIFNLFQNGVMAEKHSQDSSKSKKSLNEKVSDAKPRYQLPKDVAVIGAGVAGLSAARRLMAFRSNFTVHVYEARKERFGGRVWTDKLTSPKAKGPEMDLGAFAFNTANKNNPLLLLAEKHDLKVADIDNLQFIIPWEGRTISGEDLAVVKSDVAKILGLALNKSKSSDTELSVKEAIDSVLDSDSIHLSDSASSHLVRCFPSYVMGDYSAKHYQADQLDVGYDKILMDGMGEIVDRLVSGALNEIPLHLSLNKAVRQIKVDDEKNKMLMRFKDGSQLEADIVIVAVPVSVIASGDLRFEPALPKDYQVASNELSMAYSNKLVVQFERAFWPQDIGVFIRAVANEKERGHLQSWLNLNKIIGVPALTSFLTGMPAESFEKLSDEEAKAAVMEVLTEMFGKDVVSQGGKIVSLHRSAWISDPLSKGTATYPKVGTSPAMWEVFSKPVCPGIYFAGEHTSFDGLGTIHGAYLSGLRAADQVVGNVCEEERLKKEEEERMRKSQSEGEMEENEDSKDEL